MPEACKCQLSGARAPSDGVLCLQDQDRLAITSQRDARCQSIGAGTHDRGVVGHRASSLRTHRMGRYSVVRMAALYQIFVARDHWIVGSKRVAS